MSQKRYFVYNSYIKSKTSAEGLAIAAKGIGPVIGFNDVSKSGNSFVIGSSSNSWFYNVSGNTEDIKHALITPDGIVTLETTDLTLPLDNIELKDGDSFFLIATHNYIEDSELDVVTNYQLVKFASDYTGSSYKDKTLNDWLSKLQSTLSSYSKSNTVIVAMIYYISSSNIKIYTPYAYNWPIKDQVNIPSRYILETEDDFSTINREFNIYPIDNGKIVKVIIKFTAKDIPAEKSIAYYSFGEFPDGIIPDGFKWNVVIPFTNATGKGSDMVSNKVSYDSFVIGNTSAHINNKNTISIVKAGSPASGLSLTSDIGITYGELVFDIFIPD